MSEPFSVLVFDFDYTLADSSAGVIACVNHALQTLGYTPRGPDAIRATIGLSLPDTFATLIGQPTDDIASLVRLFVGQADRVMNECTIMLPGASEAVWLLQEQGHRMGIVSTKYRYRIEGVLEKEGLRDAFATVVGGEDVAKHKPDPESLRLALSRLGSPEGDALYIGDSETDAKTAQRAHIPFVGVLSGVTTRAQLARFPHLSILDSVSQLPGWLVARATCQVPECCEDQ